MGYCVRLNAAKFRIAQANIAEALAAVLKTKGVYDTPEKAISKINHFAHLPPIIKLQELVLGLYGLKPVLNKEETEVVGLSWHWEKYFDQEALFQALAPFVEPGSYVEWLGEDGARFRHVFDGAKCVEKFAKVVWE